MNKMNIYIVPGNAATEQAGRFLREAGVAVTEHICPKATHWLLPVPTKIPVDAPPGVTVIGGNLAVPGMDLLKDPFYLAENAAITARCAMALIEKESNGLPVLVLGWGRIGKCLGKFLAEAGAEVTIAARKEADVAMVRALGYGGIFLHEAPPLLARFDAVINTIPAMVLSTSGCRKDCALLELASQPGMTGGNIIDGRGLPGKYAPEASGRLIARTILRLCEEDME